MIIYDFKYSRKRKLDVFKKKILQSSILQGLLFILMIFIIIYIINNLFSGLLTYSIALAAPFITVALINIKDNYSKIRYETQLKSSLIDEIIQIYTQSNQIKILLKKNMRN